jgi:casein kinase 1
MLSALHSLHLSGYLHGDVNPKNFRVDSRDGTVYLIDYQLAKEYVTPSGLHVIEETGQRPLGFLPFISLNCHVGRNMSRRDDLEALGYTLLYYLTTFNG